MWKISAKAPSREAAPMVAGPALRAPARRTARAPRLILRIPLVPPPSARTVASAVSSPRSPAARKICANLKLAK
jgi:hypothetical protein